MPRRKVQLKAADGGLTVNQAARLAVKMLKEEAKRYMMTHDPIYREMCREIDRQGTKRP